MAFHHTSTPTIYSSRHEHILENVNAKGQPNIDFSARHFPPIENQNETMKLSRAIFESTEPNPFALATKWNGDFKFILIATIEISCAISIANIFYVFQWMCSWHSVCLTISGTICIIMIPQAINIKNQVMFQFAVWSEQRETAFCLSFEITMNLCRSIHMPNVWWALCFSISPLAHIWCEHYQEHPMEYHYP